jgi:hypothetical protein
MDDVMLAIAQKPVAPNITGVTGWLSRRFDGN